MDVPKISTYSKKKEKLTTNYNDPQWNYNRHKHNDHSISKDSELPPCYTNPESIDAWRHFRMHSMILPIVKEFPKATWITIGDGNYGSDAFFLENNGADVLATSLTDINLAVAEQKKYISKYKSENAEKITFSDDSYDFVLCKESYHHFPRPPIAFYEMLRVSKKGVILIEPSEDHRRFLIYLKNFVKLIIRKDKSTYFEPSGNFVYRINVREVEKMLTALNYECFAVKKFNDFYHPRLSREKYIKYSLNTVVTKFGIAIQNFLCSLKLLDYGLAAIIAFKENPSKNLCFELKRIGYQVVFLPKNPYH